MNPPSAVITPATAPKAMARPSASRVTFRFTESQAAKFGLADRWRAAVQRRQLRDARKQAAAAQLQTAVAGLLAIADAQQWSQRQLTARIGIPQTSFRRIRRNQVDPLLWLEKLSAALVRINPST